MLPVAVPCSTVHFVGAFIQVLVNQMVPLLSGGAYLSNLKSLPLESLIRRFLGIVQVAQIDSLRPFAQARAGLAHPASRWFNPPARLMP